MKRNLRFFCCLLACLTVLPLLCACQNTGTVTPEDPTPAPDPTPDVTPTPETPTAPTYTSALTGLAVSAQDAVARPVAVMIDNELNYRSQTVNCLGLSSADLLYETNIEANYSGTRIMAVFSQSALAETEAVGSVRSARAYHLTLAKMLDAFFVHEGESSTDDVYPGTGAARKYYARYLLEDGYVNNFYLTLDGETSKRDSSYRSKLCTVEVPAVAYGQKTVDYLVNRYGRTDYSARRDVFSFGENPMEGAERSAGVKLTFSDWNAYYTKSDFLYDEESGLYTRGQYLYGAMNTRTVPTDLATGAPLQFENVFVLVTSQRAIDKEWGTGGDYHITVDLAGYEGVGYYFSKGKVLPIRWKSTSDSAPIQFFTEQGTELTVNPGKSFVNLIHQNAADDLVIYSDTTATTIPVSAQ